MSDRDEFGRCEPDDDERREAWEAKRSRRPIDRHFDCQLSLVEHTGKK